MLSQLSSRGMISSGKRVDYKGWTAREPMREPMREPNDWLALRPAT